MGKKNENHTLCCKNSNEYEKIFDLIFVMQDPK